MARLIDDAGNPIDVDTDEPETEAEAVAPEADDDAPETPEQDEAEADDETEAEGEGEEDDGGELIVSIDGEAMDDEDDEGEEPSTVIRTMRKKLRESERRIKDLERQQAAAASDTQEDIGPRPTLESAGFDEDRFSDELATWIDRKRQQDQKRREHEEKQKRHNEAWQQKLAVYEVNKGKMAAPDFDEAENAVKAMFNPTAQGVLIAAAQEPEKVVYALGKSPAAASKLAALQDDPIAFAAEIARLEARVKFTPRKPQTKPEPKVRGGAPTGKTADARRFERLIEQDDMTAALKVYKDKKRA